MDRISIVIRTFNESYWIPYLIEALKKQTVQDFEIIQVDNQSTDTSVDLLQGSELNTKLVTISDYLPGAALNRGIEQSSGEILVFLSAHCIPNNRNWLEKLVEPVVSGEYQAVFGRQIPCRSTHPIDVRDLLLTFPNESHTQSKNTFFHNANSCVTKSLWLKFPFSETATNIEDRLFGEQVIKHGLEIFYSADAIVTHQHGLHQTTNLDRLRGVTNILENERILQYENETFIEGLFSGRNVTITTNYDHSLDYISSSTTIITSDKRLVEEKENAVYIPYKKDDKVLDILRYYALNYPNDYICFYNWKTSSEQTLSKLFERLRLGDLAICYGRRITNPILNSSYLNKGLLNSYSHDLRNSIQYELYFNKGLIVHSSVLLSSKNNDRIFQILEIIED